jgi:hypothetical protein
MIRNVVILLAHDLAVALKNKTFYLIICMPLFVVATLRLVDPAKAHDARMKIAWTETAASAPALFQSLEQHPELFTVRIVSTEQDAIRLLGAREVDAILTPTGSDVPHLRLTVVRQASYGNARHPPAAFRSANRCRMPKPGLDIRRSCASDQLHQTADLADVDFDDGSAGQFYCAARPDRRREGKTTAFRLAANAGAGK